MAALDAPVTSAGASGGRRFDAKEVLKNKALARMLVSAAKAVRASEEARSSVVV